MFFSYNHRKIEDNMKKNSLSRKINVMIVFAVVCFITLFSFGLRARQLAIEKADLQYKENTSKLYQDYFDKIDQSNDSQITNPSTPDQSQLVIYDNFYDLADAVELQEQNAMAFKYLSSGLVDIHANILGISYDSTADLSYARAKNKKGNKLFNINGVLADSTVKDVFTKLIGNKPDFYNTYFYNATRQEYKYKQYYDPVRTASKSKFESMFPNVNIVKNLFTINSHTIESVQSFTYNEDTETYTVVATIDKMAGSINFINFVNFITNYMCPTTPQKLQVTLTIRKDYVVTKAVYDVAARVSLSGINVNGYVDISSQITETLYSFGEDFTIQPSL